MIECFAFPAGNRGERGPDHSAIRATSEAGAPFRLVVTVAPPPVGRLARRRWQTAEARSLALGLLPAEENWRIEAEADGRPVLRDSRGGHGPDLSLAHSGGWIAAAVAKRGRIGIDLETPRPGRDPLRLAAAYFSAAESRLVAAEGEAALLALWTMREAIAKASGGGLAHALSLDGTALIAGRNGHCHLEGWRVAHRDLGGAHLAVACR